MDTQRCQNHGPVRLLVPLLEFNHLSSALSVAHAKSGIPVTALVAVTVATTVMWLSIVLVARLGRSGTGGFVHDTVTRFMGLIVIAMGVQFALSGMRSFMLEPDHAAPQHDANAAGMTKRLLRSAWL